MKTAIRLSATTFLIVPAAGAIWFVVQHIWQLYTPPRAYSFGLHLRYGAERIYDPWSDAIVLACAVTALACGVFIACDRKKKLVAACVGGVMLAIIATGVIAAA